MTTHKARVIVLFAHALCAGVAQAQSITTIPALPDAKQLPVFALQPVEAPRALLDGLVRAGKLPQDYVPVRRNADTVGIYEAGHLKAWVDVANGDTQLYPTLSALEPIDAAAFKTTHENAVSFFARGEMIPKDGSRYTVVPRGGLKQGNARGKPLRASQSRPREYLSYFMAQRELAGLPVEGPGSRALVAIGAGGVVHGAVRAWRVAKATNITATMDKDRVRAEIEQQLKAVHERMGLQPYARNLKLAYYDGNSKYIQPILQFEIATARSPKVNAPSFIGRVALVKDLEALPDLFAGAVDPRQQPTGSSGGSPTWRPPRNVTTSPTAAWRGPSAPMAMSMAAPASDDAAGDPLIKVGTFMANFGTAGIRWSVSAAAWLAAFDTDSTVFDTMSELPLASSPIVSRGADAGVPSEPAPNANVSTAQVSLFEAHGEPWTLFGKEIAETPIDVTELPLPMSSPTDWVIHSCSVVPSEVELPTASTTPGAAHWSDAWQNVLGPVRTVLGYRNRMWINDGAPGKLAHELALGASLLSAWFQVLASDTLHPGTTLGRGSAIAQCGQEDATLETGGVPESTPADCIQNWYMDNCAAGVCPTDPLTATKSP
jgi:hypothetical protein